jgi:O-antigen/teichoic acid export membrane protein
VADPHDALSGAVGAAAPPAALPSLRRNVLWTLGGNLVYGGSQWAMLAVLAKLGTPEMVGQFALALAVTAPIMQFWNLNLASLQATDARGEFAFSDYRGLRLATTVAGMLTLAAVTLAAYRGDVALALLAVGLAKGIEALSDIYFGLFQRHERMNTLGKSLLLKGPLSLVAFSAGIYATGRVFWAALAMAAAWAALLAGYDARQGAAILDGVRRSDAGDRPVARNSSGALWRLGRVALPLGFVALSASLIPNVPRYFVEHELGATGLGLFAAMAYVLVAGQNVLTAVTGSVAPRLAGAYARGDGRAFLRLLLGVLGIAAAGGGAAVALAMWVGPELLSLLYTQEYAAHADAFVRLMVAGVFVYLSYVLWGATTAARYLRVQNPLFAATAVVAVGACALLVPRDGLLGAATAVLLTFGFECIGLGVVLAVALRAIRRGPVT